MIAFTNEIQIMFYLFQEYLNLIYYPIIIILKKYYYIYFMCKK